MKKKYRIVAICQIYNEIERGNLERFITHLKPLVDAIVAYDDNSLDGSYEYLLDHTPYVIRGKKNDFINELAHKKTLLDKALTLSPDFILHIDADEVLSANAATRLQALCARCDKEAIDAMSFHKVNLWRSRSWYRVDSQYDDGWFVHLWRVTPTLSYGEPRPGLHQPPYPPSIKTIKRAEDIQVLHYGFASERLIAYKYLTYRAYGQKGYMMLDRLISEDKRELKKVPKQLVPKNLWVDEPEPPKLTFLEALTYVEKYKPDFYRPKISIVCLIYKSVDWLKFVYEQVLKYTDMRDKEFFFVANDADPSVITYLENHYIPYYQYTTTPAQKQEWYINNVYRAWNFGAEKAKGNFVVFINSDMAFTPGWLEKLLEAYNTKNCVASRLVESGRLPSGRYGIQKDFGSDFTNYKEAAFQEFAQTAALPALEDGGLYMPLLIRRDYFLRVGGYPEGNVRPNSDIFHPAIAKKGEELVSGDVILMEKLKTLGITHQTAFNSLVYHFQEGEMLSTTATLQGSKTKLIAICNDLVTGCMGERVLWDFMLETLPSSVGIDQRVVGKEGDYADLARRYIAETYPDVTVIIQNATFINLVDPERFTVVFLQDDLRSMKRLSYQQEQNLNLAAKRVTNSLQTAGAYNDFDFTIIPVGTDVDLFKPLNKETVRREMGFATKGRIGIFVGNMSEVKGWNDVKACIDHYPDITWIVVSKHKESYEAPNVHMYNRIDQPKLVKLLNCADFFIIGSPVETQCLAAIEALACNVPVIMRLVGIFRDWTPAERAQVGIFTNNFISAVDKIQKGSYAPRKMVIAKELTTTDAMHGWKQFITQAILEAKSKQWFIGNTEATKTRKPKLTSRFSYIFKYIILRRVLGGRDYTFVDFVVFIKNHTSPSVFYRLSTWWGKTRQIALKIRRQ